MPETKKTKRYRFPEKGSGFLCGETAYVWYYIHKETKKAQKKEVSDFLVIGYLYSENTCNFIYVTSFFNNQLAISTKISSRLVSRYSFLLIV